jgi:hypothetical protein
VQPWGDFPPGAHWQHPRAADFCGTGHAAVAAWDPASGNWTVGHDEARRLIAKPFGKWEPGKNWKCVATGRFGKGSAAGIAALDATTGQICVADSDGQRFTTHRYPGHPAMTERFYVGAFSGKACDELLGIAADGQLWVGKFADGSAGEDKSSGGTLRFSSWGRWPDFERLTDFRTISYWPENERRSQ